jgi:2-hydroxycyclohexanecarboxyl-CoA dehydrogenase
MRPKGSAIVTGAGSGIGQCIGREMQARGWKVASFDLGDAGGFDFGRNVDVSDEAAVATAVAEVEASLDPVVAVVACAGYYEEAALADITLAAWNKMLRTHVGGVYNLMRAVLPGMASRRNGSFITIASERAIVGAGNDAHYGSAKAAALALTRAAALEMSASGVRVNAIAPGPTDTPLLQANSWERQSDFIDRLPARRIANPQEVALIAAALAEQEMFLNGAVISVNSGTVM